VGGMKRCAQQFFHFLSYRTCHESEFGGSHRACP
jgi:hypothetical protein